MVNLITKLVAWRLYGEGVESDTLYRDFMVKSVWRLSEALIEKI